MSASWRGVLVSRSHISFYLRTGEGELDDMCSSSYRQAWGILLRNVIYYYYSYYYYLYILLKTISFSLNISYT